MWPINVFFKITGELCHSISSKVFFCGVPAMAVFVLWVAMLQGKGRWALSQECRTAEQCKRMTNVRLLALFSLIPLSVILLFQAMSWICSDGCATGMGDGDTCVKDGLS